MTKKKKNPWDGLDQRVLPNLELNQSVKVKKGEHKGKKGKVVFYRSEGNDGRLTLVCPDGSVIYVNGKDIDYKYETVNIKLMMTEEERIAFEVRIKEYEEGYS